MDQVKQLLIRGVIFLMFAGAVCSCVSVANYQKIYLNDDEMALRSRKIEYFENNIHAYREGAVGANGGKTGGGCGCN